ncbi:MAG TPA: hypothetical protein VHT97_15590 [Acidimicrobiales bacterium]|jgi:hypothetical protein|nr:hypothetical protein [Acidimicrobiales bacterium]
MLVLAPQPDGCVGVDLDSGAFVRAIYPPAADEPLEAFDVTSAPIGAPVDPPDTVRPEAVALAARPERIGSLRPKRAERYLQALRHPPQGPLLGFAAVSVPYWTLVGDRPSLALVEPTDGPLVLAGDAGYECRFGWQGTVHQLPLGDRRLAADLVRLRRRRSSPRELTRLLGFRPGRLLVVVAGPSGGHCTKQVAALLPGR